MTKSIVIFGPTATGKTNIALELAKKYKGELISADSRQVYKDMDIGSGKVGFASKIEKRSGYWIVDGINVYGLDLVSPGNHWTVADFLTFASEKIEKLKTLPIVVGGTGFYIKSLLEGIDSAGIPKNDKLRDDLEKLSTIELYQKLSRTDLLRANSMNQSDRQNPRRLIRALEIALYKKHTSEVRLVAAKHTSEVKRILIIGLTAPNDFIYSRSDQWLETRLNHGLIEEVERLIKNGASIKWLDSLGLEFRWISRFITNKVSEEEAVERLRGDIHDLIRSQKTWFKKFPQIKLSDISQKDWKKELEKTVKAWYTQS